MTQFELATAAAFVALAAARVEAAVIEAGLGGRLDATNTIPSQVTVLTSVGLDHTEWLGETEVEIAAEKLAVLRDQTTLVLGRVSPRGRGAGRADRGRARRRLVVRARGPGAGAASCARRGAFQRRNFALACAAAEAFLGELDRRRVARGRGDARRSPAGWSGSPTRPADLLDAAHNPDGAARPGRGAAGASPAAAGSSPAWRSSPTRTPAAMVAGAGAGARAAPSAPSCRRRALDGARAARAPVATRRAELARGLRGGGACRRRPSRASTRRSRRGTRARRGELRRASSSSPAPTTCIAPGPRALAYLTVRGFAHGSTASAGSELLSMMAPGRRRRRRS